MKLSALLALSGVVALAMTSGTRAEETQELQPYQMMRSLQSLQDRIADGDHAALPMQSKLLEMIDKRFRDATDEEFSDPKNVRAVLLYGMSGGNPSTLQAVLRRKTVPEDSKKIGTGVLGYLRGNMEVAQAALKSVDPKTAAPEVRAFLALIVGSVNATGDAAFSLQQFDRARLDAPGTLIEEAALRRSLPLHVALNQPAKFYQASGQYVRRFLRSPYASQFADSFVTGVLALNASPDLAAIDAITGEMAPDQRQVIYLRLARRAAVDGYTELAAYASAKAEANPDARPGDARSKLYASLSTLTSGDVEQVRAGLKSIDRSQLTESDLRLLDAALAVADEVTASANVDDAPQPAPVAKAEPAPEPEPVAKAGAAARPAPRQVLPGEPQQAADKPVAVEQAAPPAAGIPASDEAGQVASAQKSDTGPVAAPTVSDAADAKVQDTRAKLSAIDDLLKDAK